MISVFKKKRQIHVSYLFSQGGQLSFGQVVMNINGKIDSTMMKEVTYRIKDFLETDSDIIILNIIKFE